MRTLPLLLALLAISQAYVVKRSNSYGDEAVTPAPAGPAPSGDAGTAPADAGSAPAGDAGAAPTAPAEEAPKAAEQPAPCGEPKSEASGYRAKRSNSYGDEAVTPAPSAPAGDAGAAPADAGTGPAPTAPAEEAPKPADQPAPCGEAKSEASGYRVKRSNSYGDEAVTPAPAAPAGPAPGGDAGTAPADAGAEPSAPSTPAEEAPKAAEQPAPCGDAKTEASGYRVKRSNSYGDEAVTPAAPAADAGAGPAPSGDAPAPSTPAEEAPKPAEQPAPCGEAKTQASGYRVKRSNAYGDEAVTPAPAGPAPAGPAPSGDAGTAPADAGAGPAPETPAEEAPKPAEQPAPCGDAKTEASGYRAKRSNAYGDEAVTPAPSAPAGDAGTAPADAGAGPAPTAPAEEAPKPADQPAPCGEAKTQASGYRI